MRFEAEKGDMLAELSPVKAIVPRTTPVLALKNVLLEAADGAVQITATDLETAYLGEFKADVKAKGKLAVPASQLIDWIGLLPDGRVTFSTDKALRATIQSGSSRLRVGCMDRQEFPVTTPPPQAQVRIEADILAALLRRAALSIIPEEGTHCVPGALLIESRTS